MIWFLVVMVMALLAALQWGEAEKLFTFFGITLMGEIVVFIVLMFAAYAAPETHHDTTTNLIGPVAYEKFNDTYFYTYRDASGTHGINPKGDQAPSVIFKDGSARTVTVRDYTPSDPWVMPFNWHNDDVIFTLPQSETVLINR